MMVRLIRFSFPFLSVFLILAVVVTAPIIMAQSSCPIVIQEAITVLGDNCTGISRNNACYGNVDVEAQFVTGFEVPFDRAGDLAQLLNMQRISTSPIDTTAEEWGIALLSVQANIPDTIPGQAVIFMLMGDSEIENAIEPDGTRAGERFPVTTRRSGSLRIDPSASSRILTFIPGNTSVSASALSDDGQWLRVTYNGQTGWIIARMVQTLPTFTTPASTDVYTPMQSFYLRTGIGNPDCVQAPNTLMIQGPRDFSIDLTVNGADIRIGSTVFLRNIAPDIMQLIVAEGQATLYPDTPNARIVPTGGFSTICLDAPRDLGVDGVNNDREVRPNCVWTTPQLFTEWEQFEQLDDLPPDVLIYDFELPNEPIIVEDCELNPDWQDEYIVQVNDNLSLIAPRYALTTEQLGFGNCLINYDIIRVGQILRVPRLLVGGGEVPPVVVVEAPPVVVTPPPPPLYVDLQFSATSSMATPAENENYAYTLTVTNIGTQDATNVIANTTFPFNHAEYVSHVASQGVIVVPIGVWTIGTIPAGGSATLTINATARPGEAAAGSFDLPFALTSLTEPDTNGANNTSVATVDIGYYVSFIYVTDTSQTIANDGFCTLTEAINNANNNNFSNTQPLLVGECSTGKIAVDMISLSNDSYTTDAVPYFQDGINALPIISSDIYINGQGHTIQLTAGVARLFYVAIGSGLTLDNVTVRGGRGSINNDGGAIYNRGATNIINGSVITDNEVSGTGGGGAIYNLSGVVVMGSSITDNRVLGGGAVSGGAIKNNGGSVTIIGSDISDNTVANGHGGALASSGLSATVNITGGTTFNTNNAFAGGAIYIDGGIFSVTDASFNGNLVGAGGDGGAVYIFNAVSANMTTGVFSNNTTADGYGGAIYVNSGNLTLTGYTFQNNSANGLAGEGGVAYVLNGTVTFNTNTFNNNTTSTTNGTVAFAQTLATVNFNAGNNMVFSNPSECDGTGTFTNDASNIGVGGSCW